MQKKVNMALILLGFALTLREALVPYFRIGKAQGPLPELRKYLTDSLCSVYIMVS